VKVLSLGVLILYREVTFVLRGLNHCNGQMLIRLLRKIEICNCYSCVNGLI
jgi:hypothetical protein